MKIDKAIIQNILKNKKYQKIIIGVMGAVAVITLLSVVSGSLNKGETTYREATVEYGNLTVGVEIDGNISVGTTTQELDVDISAYTSSSSLTFSNMSNMGSGGSGGGSMPSMGTGMGMSMGGGMSMSPSSGGSGGGGITFGGASNTSSGDRTLKVEAVYVAVGQTVSAGDPLVKLSEESVSEIRSQLEEDVTSAEVTYRQQETEATLADLSSEQTLATNQNQGSYASIEYSQTLSSLQSDVDTAQENYDDAYEKLTELQEELAEYQALLSEYKSLLDNANYSATYIDVHDSVYGWVTAENARESAQSMYDNLVQSIEDTEDSIASQENTVAKYNSNLVKAVTAQKEGLIDAKATYDKAVLNNTNAQEIYDVSKKKTELANDIALDEYNKAKEKLDEFNSKIDGQNICALYDGVVTEVMVSPGDYIGTGTSIMTVNDYDKVTITVNVEEADIEYAQEGSRVNIYVPALKDEEYSAEVTEVGDATYDSSSSTTYYEVTVTLSGNTARLYEGMNAEVTFITKESEKVLYVSNRAIIRDGSKSKVKIKDSKGNIVTRSVETGFSDGNSVEIKSGLEEGDIVLIESKVSD